MQPIGSERISELKTRLEVEKLKAEVENLHRSSNPLARNATLITTIIAAVSIGIGLFQFNQQQKANAIQRADQSASEEAGRAEELKKTYWQEQKKVYDLALNSAGLIAKASSLRDVTPQTKQFWGLYWGDMSLIESHEVELAMIAFGKSLGSWESSGIKPKEIEDISYALAHCMKQSLSKTWRPASGKEVRDTACPYDN